MLVISLILIAMIVTYWFITVRSTTKPKRKKVPRTDYQQHPYHAVSIRHSGCACSSVTAVGDRRFLAEKVPNFPLPSCDAPRCDCRYVHHNDRREDGRRALYSLNSDFHILAGHTERRHRKGRRQSDHGTDLASDFDFKNTKWSA